MLARKISRAKWDAAEYLAEVEIRADAVTGCLRTSNDSLSWWHCEGDEQDVEEVALALATGPKTTKFEKIDVVVLPETDLLADGLASEPTEGDTPIKELRSRHVNVVKLDLERLAKIARILAPRIRSNDSVFHYTKVDLMTLVRKAINNKRLNVDDLNPKLRKELNKT